MSIASFCKGKDQKVLKVLHTSVKVLALYLSTISLGIIIFLITIFIAGVFNLILLVSLVLAWIIVGVLVYIHWKREVYVLTDKSIIACQRILGTDIKEIEYERIQGAKLDQGLLYFLNIGTIIVDTGSVRVSLKNIDSPKEILDFILDKT